MLQAIQETAFTLDDESPEPESTNSAEAEDAA